MSRGEEILSEFLENIDRYIKSLHLGVVEENQNISKLLNFQFSDFEKLTATECGSAAYQLYAYAEYIETWISTETSSPSGKLSTIPL